MGMGIAETMRFLALEKLVGEQQRRIEALEAALLRRKPLDEINECRRADANRLRQAISQVLAEHADSGQMTAKQIARALECAGFDQVPPERTLRRHLNAVRGHGQTASGRQS